MESLKKFAANINEGRRPSKKEAEEIHDKEAEVAAKVKPGVDAEDNGTEGTWEIDPPTNDDLLNPIKKDDPDMVDKNKKAIAKRLRAGKSFLILGEAGWGKTSVITSVAKRYGYTIITVYLDKAQKEDLGGIPAYGKTASGIAYQELLMPGWALYMLERPKEKFLLFFDEMNQADSQVMNALMPIVLRNVICGKKFNNFVAAAAGNFEWENEGGVNDVSGPLMDRFGGRPIIWETNWKNSFAHLHKKWDAKLSKDLIDAFESCSEWLRNPRAVEIDVFDEIIVEKNSDEPDFYDVDDWYDTLLSATKRGEELNREGKRNLTELAEKIYEFVNSKDEPKSTGRGSGKRDVNMVSEEFKDKIKNCMRLGFYYVNGTKYGVSRENISALFCDPEISEEPMPNEVLQRLINKFEADDIAFKYEKDAEWKEAGLEDPLAD